MEESKRELSKPNLIYLPNYENIKALQKVVTGPAWSVDLG